MPDTIKGMISEGVEIVFHIEESQRRLEEIKVAIKARAEEQGETTLVGDYGATATISDDGEVIFTNGD
jgi:hypothetical protein